MANVNLWELKRKAKQYYPTLPMQVQWLRRTVELLQGDKHVLHSRNEQYRRDSVRVLSQFFNGNSSHHVRTDNGHQHNRPLHAETGADSGMYHSL